MSVTRRLLFSALCCTVLGVGCDTPRTERSAGPSDRQLPYPARSDSIAGPGSPLLDGFVVEDGSWLLGAPFPYHTVLVGTGTEESHGRNWYSWSAYLALTGDPHAVAAGFLRQGRSLGFSDGNVEPECETDKRCGGELYREEDGTSSDRVTLTVETVRGAKGLSNWETDLAIVTVGGIGGTKKPQVTDRAVDNGDARPESPSGDIPSVGDRFGGVQFEVDGRPVGRKVWLTVEGNSRLVMPPLLDPRGETLGPTMIAIFRIEGDVRSLMGRYRGQAQSFYPGDPSSEEWELNADVDVTQYASYCPAGCGGYEAVAIQWIDGVTYGLIRAGTRS